MEKLGEIYPHDDPNTIQLDYWAPILGEDGDPSGTCKRVGGRKLPDIRKDIVCKLETLGLSEKLDYFHLSLDMREKDAELSSNVRWIACYAVTGGSEGHYIHVDIIDREDTRRLLFLGKTFEGMDCALEISNALAKMLSA